jgi:His-Xaa-Ser system protein HxsD
MTTVEVDLGVYPLEVVLRTCHPFSARFHVSVKHSADATLTIGFSPADDRVAGEFANALLDQQLRAIVAEETKAIRELLVAQAFCESGLLDRRDSESDEYADPRGIAR